MELEDELTKCSWGLGMRYDHKDDSDAFTDGYGGIATHML